MVTKPLPGRRSLILGTAGWLLTTIGRRDSAYAEGAPAMVVLRAGGHWGHLTVTNTGTNPVFLRAGVVVESLADGVWRPLATEMNLVAACDPDGVVRQLPDHVALPAGASLTPPPWRGWSCNGQCERHCRNNTYWGTGPFRFRILAQDGRSSASAPFAMPRVPTRPDDAL